MPDDALLSTLFLNHSNDTVLGTTHYCEILGVATMKMSVSFLLYYFSDFRMTSFPVCRMSVVAAVGGHKKIKASLTVMKAERNSFALSYYFRLVFRSVNTA